MDEFLAVRALGILCLLAAEPLLDAAFFRYEPSRLLVTVFAYLMVVAGLFWVTMPYLLRDQIAVESRGARAAGGSLHGFDVALRRGDSRVRGDAVLISFVAALYERRDDFATVADRRYR